MQETTSAVKHLDVGTIETINTIPRGQQSNYKLSHRTDLPFVTCVALAKTGLVVGPLRPSVCPSVRLTVRSSVLNTFGVPSLCNL